ncbi:MAG: hypothetical protein ACYTAF_16185, partial [Planctomycetota bacterium]
MLVLLFAVVCAGCDGSSSSSSKVSLKDAVKKALGDLGANPVRAEWDDGSGGRPEKVLVAKGMKTHLFVPDAKKGWRMSFHIYNGHRDAGGKEYEPAWYGISKEGNGYFVGYRTDEGFSVSVFCIDGTRIEQAPFRAGSQETRDDMTEKLSAFMISAQPDADEERARASAARIVEL